MMTENEAKTKACPFAPALAFNFMSPTDYRGSVTDGPGISVPHRKLECLASACMMWRFVPQLGETIVEAIKRHRNDNSSSLLEAKTYVEAHPEYIRRPRSDQGYCGLAGKPEAT